VGKIAKSNLPCVDPDCGSSDALQVYEDGDSFCFSCQKFFTKEQTQNRVVKESPPKQNKGYEKELSVEQIRELPVRGFKERDITKQISEFYDVRISYGTDGNIDAHYYPYNNCESYKKRKLPKEFYWINKSDDLFGRHKFQGGGKRLIICEGEIDTLSVAQAVFDHYNTIYPVVGISSSAMTKSILKHREWIRSFGEVIICFDEDDAGEKARKEAIKIVGYDKVKITKLPTNDVNELLLKEGSKAVMRQLFDAVRYIPSGIIGKDLLWQSLIDYNNKPSIPFPECLEGVNHKTKGRRSGEITLFISGTGSGKTTLLREIIIDIIQNKEEKLGIISLEESPAETARKLSGMALNRNPANEEIPIEELKAGFDQIFGNDRILILDHQGSINDNSITDQLEYMCLMGCTTILIDHITILVSEGVENLTGNEAQDKMMNELLRLVKRHPVWIGLVSHLRKTPSGGKSFEEGRLPTLDDIRGSGSIKQISFDIIAFARNLSAADDVERNIMLMSVLKCRFTGLTGQVPGAYYVYETGRLKPLNSSVVEFTSLD
jgi:twinkle protein